MPSESEPGNSAGRLGAPPSAAAAEDTLRDLRAIGSRSRRAATRDLLTIPLVSWGIAWAAGYTLLDLAPWRVAVPAGAALVVAALTATWLCRARRTVRSGWERRTRLGWAALMLCSPFLVASVSPVPGRVLAIFLGALWGAGLLLFAVAAGDRPLGIVGAFTVLVAAFCRPVLHPHALLGFGLLAGGAMLALGAWRLFRPALRHRLPSELWLPPTPKPRRRTRRRLTSRNHWPRCCALPSTRCCPTRPASGCRQPCTACRPKAR